VKVSGKKVAEHRAALVETAKKLLKERGFDGAGVVEISREAGLSQGALYGQFKSKDVLTAEAVRKAFADGAEAWNELRDNAPGALGAYLDAYLSDTHLTDPGSGCMIPACISEIPRQGDAIGAAFTEGFSTMVEVVQRALPSGTPPEEARRRALTLISTLVGCIALARAVEPTDPALAKEIISAARDELKYLAIR
jgi:TetR/AcrR family transcriptional repressor of nem operon